MEKPLVSVVIPVYNGEQVIRKSLNNILKQTVSSVEIIVVDDGSTDSTADICKQLGNEIPNLKYVYQNNAGPGVARNTGLEQSTGKYIYFADADDEIDEKLLEDNVQLAVERNADIVVFGYKKIEFNRRGKLVETDTRLTTRYMSGKNEVENSLIQVLEEGAIFAVWNKLFKKDFLSRNSITFPDIRRNEDISFVLDCFKNVESMAVNPNIYYMYRPEYSPRKYDLTLIDQHLFVFDKFYHLFENWMQVHANRAYACKLFVLYFFHSVPFFVVSYDEKPARKLQEMFNAERFKKYMREFELSDSDSFSVKLGLIFLSLRSPVLLTFITRLKLLITNYVGKNLFRKLIRSERKSQIKSL